MAKRPRHRPARRFPGARREIVECEFSRCVHCGELLQARKPWHMRKWVQTLDGPVFVDYRNPDGFVFTTRMNVENEPVISTLVGGVPVELMAHCGNNTWREMGSPGKKK